MLADAKALGQSSKSWLPGESVLRCASKCLGRKHSDELHILMAIIELVNVLE